jgi:hypothetical protein
MADDGGGTVTVTLQDVRDALRMLRELTGGSEPYAPHVYPTARAIARIVEERMAARDAYELRRDELGKR